MDSTLMPGGIHVHSPHILLLQIRYARYRNQDSDKSPFSHKIGKSHTAFQSALHRPVQIFQNYLQHSDNTLNPEDCEAGK